MGNAIQTDIKKTAQPMASGSKSLANKIWRQKSLLILMIPGIIYFIVFHYIPMYGLVISFKDFDVFEGIFNSPWVGLKHFKFFSSLPYFWQVVGITLKVSVLKLATGFFCPIILALLLNELQAKVFKRVVQTISYLPHFLSWVVITGIVFQLLSNSYGLYGYLCNLFNWTNPQIILQTENGFMATLLISNIWKEIGYGSIIYLATISGISPELYESAVIDGAGRFRQCISITLPSMSTIIAIMLVLSMGGLLGGSFEQIYNLRNPIVAPAFETIDIYVLGLARLDGSGGGDPQYSLSAAVGFARSAISMILVLSCNWIVGKFAKYSAF